MPSATFTHTVTVPLSTAEMWALLQDPRTWAAIGPLDEVREPTSDDSGLAGFEWRATAAGRTWDGTARRDSVEAGTKMVLALESSEMGGWISAAVGSEGDGASLEVTLHARSVGMLASMFWGVVSGSLGRGLTTQVDALAKRLS